MFSPKALFTNLSWVIWRQAHSAPSRLHLAKRRRIRPPETYTFAVKPIKRTKDASPPKAPRAPKPKPPRRRAFSKERPKPVPLQSKPIKGISTFNPHKLVSSDWLDLSDRYCVVPHLKQLFGKPGFKERPRPIYFRDVQRYPPSTKGFFYFDRPSPLPHPAAGSLRFRIVPEANPALFASGHDLVDVQTGIAWEKHLVHLKMNKSDRHLYDAILQEGLLTPDEDRRITEMHPKGILNLYRGTRSQVLNSILDPFLVNFSVTSFRLTIIDPDRIYQINKSHRWANNIKGPTRSPYSGIGLCEFVLLDKGDGKMRLGIRLIKYVEPPEPEAKLSQAEGDLVKKYTDVRRTERPVEKCINLLSEHSYHVLRESPSRRFVL